MKIITLMLVSCFLLSCSDEVETKQQSTLDNNTISASGELVSSDNAVVSPPHARGMWRYKITFMAPEGKLIQKGRPLIGFDGSQLKLKLINKQNELKTAHPDIITNRTFIAIVVCLINNDTCLRRHNHQQFNGCFIL